ncbi:MAG: hypothetical protein KGZ56_07250, partial [Dethiobacter sp.]|nr:hypothetical protein [Dethiobacter sp.]
MHKCEIFDLDGDSYRLKHRKRILKEQFPVKIVAKCCFLNGRNCCIFIDRLHAAGCTAEQEAECTAHAVLRLVTGTEQSF